MALICNLEELVQQNNLFGAFTYWSANTDEGGLMMVDISKSNYIQMKQINKQYGVPVSNNLNQKLIRVDSNRYFSLSLFLSLYFYNQSVG